MERLTQGDFSTTRRDFVKIFSTLGVRVALSKLLPFTERPRQLERFQAVESVLRQAYQLYFRKMDVGGKKLLLRIPFAQMDDRYSGQNFLMAGKGHPEYLWEKIEELLRSSPFANYQEGLARPGRKLVLFDLPRQSFQFFFDKGEIERIRASYQGSRLYPYEIKGDFSLSEVDVYNFIYSVGRIGIDCSGFSFFLQRSLASHFGIDLCEEIGRQWGLRAEDIPLYIGTDYYRSRAAERIDDRINNLRPGDIILFPTRRRPVTHSAVIYSVDFRAGLIKYFQNTDWTSDRGERGPHSSEIIFDPAFPEVSLSNSSLVWNHVLGPVFDGDYCPYQDWRDGDRYNLPPYYGQVVRLKRVAGALERRHPLYYLNLFLEDSVFGQSVREKIPFE